MNGTGPVLRARGLLTTLHVLFFASGVAGLGYQMVWVRLFSVGLGHELPSVLAVVGAFFAGLALGAWLLDGRIARTRWPGRWYAALEGIIGLWAVASIWLIGYGNDLALSLIGLEPTAGWQWAVSFAIPFFALAPATTAMGATLPAMERFAAPLSPGGRCVGGLYAANTAGAVTGTVLGAFVLAPRFGYAATIVTLAAVNLVCALAALLLSRAPNEAEPDSDPTSDVPTQAEALSKRRVGVTVFGTGLLGIGFQVAGVRLMAQVLENTVYTYAASLSVYLLCTAVGAAVYQRLAARASPRALLAQLLAGLAFACLLGGYLLEGSFDAYIASRDLLGDSVLAVFGAEMAIAARLFALPTLLMGATFSHLVQAARGKEGGVGWSTALNTLGGSLAPILFGVLLLPALTCKWTLAVVAAGYLFFVPRPLRRLTVVIGLAAVAMLGVLAVTDLRLLERDGEDVVAYSEGVMATVAVLRDGDGELSLRVNNRYHMGGTAERRSDERQGHVPLLLHPHPRRALFLGLGTGITMSAARYYPGLEADGVELLPEVVEVIPHFVGPLGTEEGRRILTADARRVVRAAEGRYDVIVADLFHPGRDGAGTLYTREHFEAVRDRLSEDGLFCQWLPLDQLDARTLQTIVRTYCDVFPSCTAFLLKPSLSTPLGLVARREGSVRLPPEPGARPPEERPDARRLAWAGLDRELDLAGLFVAGPDRLATYAGDGPLNVDDLPTVMFQAPEFACAFDAFRHEALASLMTLGVPDARRILGNSGDDDRAQRLSDRLAARNAYLEARLALARGDEQEARRRLVEAIGLDAELDVAYEHGIALARRLAQESPVEARALLEALSRARPSRPEAPALLHRLPAP